MHPLDAIKALALRATTNPTPESQLRKIFRWYSKNFSTPLHEVEELPIEQVLLHYFEDLYDDMDPNELENEINEITETEEEREIRLKKEKVAEDSDEAFLRAATEEAAKEAAKAAPPPASPPAPKDIEIEELPDISMKFDDNLDKWGDLDPLGVPGKPPPKIND